MPSARAHNARRTTLLLVGLLGICCPASAFLIPRVWKCRGLAASTTTTNNPTSAPTPTKAASLPSTKHREELLTLVTMPEDVREGREESIAQRIEFVVGQLKETYVPPQTLPFMNLLLQGSWLNVYNSWTVRRKMAEARGLLAGEEEDEEDEDDFLDLLGPAEEEDWAAGAAAAALGGPAPVAATQVALREFQQTLSPNVTTGGIVNTVQWECTASEEGDTGLAGALIVRSGYEVNSRGLLEMGEVEHDLSMRRAPRNPDALIRAVQRVVPFDVFDPNGTFVETAFLDHELRVTLTHSTRFGTITSLYARNGTDLHRQMQQHLAQGVK